MSDYRGSPRGRGGYGNGGGGSPYRGGAGYDSNGGGGGGYRGGFGSPRGGGGRGRNETPTGGSPFGSPRGGGRGGYGSPGGSPRGGHSDMPPMPVTNKAPKSMVVQPLSHGTVGRPIELITNFFRFSTSGASIFHYDVDTVKDLPTPTGSPDTSSTSSGDEQRQPPPQLHQQQQPLSSSSSSHSSDTGSSEDHPLTSLDRFIKIYSPLIIRIMTEQHTAIFQDVDFIFDGLKNFYTVQKLKLGPAESHKFRVSFEMDGRPANFIVKLSLVEVVDTTLVAAFLTGVLNGKDVPDRIMSIFEILFRNVSGLAFESFRNKFFDLATAQRVPRIPLVEFVQGFASGVKLTEMGLALNMHLKTSTTVSQQLPSLLDLAKELGNIRTIVRNHEGKITSPHRNQLVDVNRFVRHLKMFTIHTPGRGPISYTIDGLIDRGPRDFTFQNREGQTLTIEEYFLAEYTIVLQDLPLVKTTGRQARYIPLELCQLAPRQFLANHKMNSIIQRELLAKSTHTPNVYFNKLDSFVRKVANSNVPLQRAYGVELDPRPVSIKARVLPTPRVMCPTNRDPFHTVKSPPTAWAVFCFDQTIDSKQLTDFVAQLMARARLLGLNLPPPSPVAIVGVLDATSVANAILNLKKRTQAEFVFVGIPGRHLTMRPAHMYAMIKHECDQHYGIMSQCFNVDKLLQTPGGYFDNFLLKTNGKLGGLNAVLDPSHLQTLSFKSAETMLIGIDVNHPGESERVSSSIAVALGSLDSSWSVYTPVIRVQKKNKDEIIKKLDDMIYALLDEFAYKNHRHPANLIIFRDGVAEGQFEKIRKIELPMIKEGINKTGKPIKVTLIVTQKRHSTRFALTQPGVQGRRPTWNVPSGTVIDHSIVNPTYKSFYMNSHFSQLGTSRPTKYLILHDDLNMTADEVEKMTFFACYNSIRTRSVLAIPTPVRYANLCSARTKVHVEAQHVVRDLIAAHRANPQARVEGAPATHEADLARMEEALVDNLNEMVRVNEDLKNRLYYC